MEASEIAAAINLIPKHSNSGLMSTGETPVGNYARMPLIDGGGGVGLINISLARTMLDLQQGEFRIPRLAHSFAVSLTRLKTLGTRGLVHRDINGITDGNPRGPFDIGPTIGVPDYPALWSHKASRERRLVVSPDCQGNVREGCEEQAVRVWQTATRLHFTLDFRLNSQSLAACLTPAPAIGGTAWPNFAMQNRAWEKPTVLWCNSTLGLMTFWWAGSRQQQGRARLTISRLPELHVFDARNLADELMRRCAAEFDRLKTEVFLPANEAYRCPARRQLDRFVLLEMLHLPEKFLKPFENLRLQWCAEPSVHGGKGTAPESEPRL